MNELSLFSGAGGGLLATKYLLGWKHVGYVEKEEYCQQQIASRIKDGLLDDAPIFGDVEAFIGEGYAEAYQGVVDVISAGFVCTDVSLANQEFCGLDGERSGATWDFTRDCIRIIRPRKVWLENSPAILVRGFERVANDLAAMGYSFRWGVLGAAHIGGLHERERWWCLATDAISDGLERRHVITKEREAANRSVQTLRESEVRMALPDPGAFRECDDYARRVDRLTAIGNAQVPGVAAAAWKILNNE